MRLQHEGFDLIDGGPDVLKGDLDIARLDRLKSCLDGFRSGNNSIEAELFRVVDLFVFHKIIAAVPVSIHIIRDGNGNDELSRIAIIEIPETVPAKCNRVY